MSVSPFLSYFGLNGIDLGYFLYGGCGFGWGFHGGDGFGVGFGFGRELRGCSADGLGGVTGFGGSLWSGGRHCGGGPGKGGCFGDCADLYLGGLGSGFGGGGGRGFGGGAGFGGGGGFGDEDGAGGSLAGGIDEGVAPMVVDRLLTRCWPISAWSISWRWLHGNPLPRHE